jgi:cytochrome P450
MTFCGIVKAENASASSSMTPEEIRAQMNLLLTAGYESTASTFFYKLLSTLLLTRGSS